MVIRFAHAKKTFTIGEELIMPSTKDICCELLGEDAVRKISQVPLSASTVTYRIEEIAEDIETQAAIHLHEHLFNLLFFR